MKKCSIIIIIIIIIGGEGNVKAWFIIKCFIIVTVILTTSKDVN